MTLLLPVPVSDSQVWHAVGSGVNTQRTAAHSGFFAGLYPGLDAPLHTFAGP
ncbi:MAG: hypothetical protein ABSF69_18865 [Polyangiaceae bacterium]